MSDGELPEEPVEDEATEQVKDATIHEVFQSFVVEAEELKQVGMWFFLWRLSAI